MKQEVEFFSRDGLKIAGNLYMPVQNVKGGKLPAVVLCQGLSGIKEKVLPTVAEAFASAGYIALAFDYCGCGESEDRRPRPYLFPLERAEDVFSAIAYLKSLSNVDKNLIGLYGLSYGGGIAMYSAALDTSVKAAVFVSSPGGGSDFMSSLRTEKSWHSFQEDINIDRIRRVRNKASKLLPLEEVIPFPVSFWTKYRQLDNPSESESIPEPSQGKENASPMMTLESAEAMIMFRPDCYIHLLTQRPVIFIHGEKDDVAHLEIIRKVYKKARSPKNFVTFKGMDHIDLDRGKGLKRQVSLSIRWFDKYLKNAEGGVL